MLVGGTTKEKSAITIDVLERKVVSNEPLRDMSKKVNFFVSSTCVKNSDTVFTVANSRKNKPSIFAIRIQIF